LVDCDSITLISMPTILDGSPRSVGSFPFGFDILFYR